MRTKKLSVLILIFAVVMMITVYEGIVVAEDDIVGGGEIIYSKPVKSCCSATRVMPPWVWIAMHVMTKYFRWKP